MIANATEGRPGLVPTAIGVAGLAILVSLLPVLGDPEVTLVEFVSAYVLLPMGALLYGLLLLAADLTVPKLLLLGAVAGVVGATGAYLGGRPEELIEDPAVRPLALLFVPTPRGWWLPCAWDSPSPAASPQRR